MPYTDVYTLPWPENLIHDFKFIIDQQRPVPHVINITIIEHLLSYTTPRRMQALLYRYQNQAPYTEVGKILGKVKEPDEPLSAGGAHGLVAGAINDMIYRYRLEQIDASCSRPTIADLRLSKKSLNILRANGLIYIEDIEEIMYHEITDDYDPFNIIKHMSPKVYYEIMRSLNSYNVMKRYRNHVDFTKYNPDYIIEIDADLRIKDTICKQKRENSSFAAQDEFDEDDGSLSVSL